MPKKTKKQIQIKSLEEAQEALARMDEIQDEIDPLMKEAVDLKKAVTEFAVKKKITVIQLDGAYYRQINRNTRMWVATPDDMPEAVAGAKSLREICKGITVKIKGKQVPLWNLVTRRVPDPAGIDKAVNEGWISEKEISKAYVEKPQAPFLQRYTGEADDA